MKFLSEINDAGKVKIIDAAGNFTSENVEGALAELASFASGGNENLTLTALTLGNYRIVYNEANDTLDFEYIL